jgi:N-succinyldiaminopimelate aminotransferase
MNPNLERLQPYPFERLARLKQGIVPPSGLAHIALSIGEPKHPTPGFIADALIAHLHGMAGYPTTRGTPELRSTIAQWLSRRFSLASASIDPQRNVLPVGGTREALFAFAQCVIDPTADPIVLLPNPFYQIYEGAALLAGATPAFVNISPARGNLPDFDSVPNETWERCQLLYLCTPGNPTGAVIPLRTLQGLIRMADQYDFVIASDECYSEIYDREDLPPPGLLQAAASMGRDNYRRCMAFHSLSKRSNVPGLRSGFVAGDIELLQQFFLYRTYHGCTMPPHTQAASRAAWSDEGHVRANRELYRQKFDAVLEILSPVLKVRRPEASFYLWPETPGNDEEFARDLFAEQNVTVLPGTYLSREAGGRNPGRGRVRMALVAPVEDCVEAARRIRRMLSG